MAQPGLIQFRLRNLFTVTAAVAVSLGVWRVVGSRAGLAFILGVEFLLPFVWRRRWLYSWFLPLVFVTVAWHNFHYPGDEYAGFFLGGCLEGLWIFAIIDDNGWGVDRAAVFVVGAGAATVSVAGWLLDKLRVPYLAWCLLLWLTAGAVFAWSLSLFPTVERALAKNGSYEAYILPAINLGLIAATAVTFAGTGFFRVLQRFSRIQGASEA